MNTRDLLALEYLCKKYNETNIPLYLSYPTTAFWGSRSDDDVYYRSFSDESVSFLYFHFPYCKKHCYYCCCYSEATGDEEKKETYIRYIKKELLQKLPLISSVIRGGLREMHWGGGTPTYLGCKQIEDVFTAITDNIRVENAGGGGISIEAYPDETDLPFDKLKLLRDLGFNEISFGIQDFDNRIQRAINRDCNEQTVRRIVTNAKKAGLRVHIDLCYGLPFQGLHESETTIRTVIDMNPDRIALFPYAHYPALFPMQRFIPQSGVPNSFMKVLVFMECEAALISAGYRKIGIDHFVKPENPLWRAACEKRIVKDFMGYSRDARRAFIGFGSSAISFSGNGYFHNATSIKDYFTAIDEGRLPLRPDMSHMMSPDDMIRNGVIQKSILSDGEIDKNHINAMYSIDFDRYFARECEELREYEKDGLLCFTSDDIVKITPTGLFFARHIAHVFDSWYRSGHKTMPRVPIKKTTIQGVKT
ncbi:MAG: oxygen-independent coproporphyrinogen III oxidase [Spirochaetales bacterium]|nr:oxygen-independent coproporphyrinogen III oxidase [Spirochaetales bacterium]